MKIQYLLLLLVSFRGMGQSVSDVKNLPLREIQSSNPGKILFVYFTGDGGWNKFSQQLVEEIKTKNNSVIVFDSRKYFWDVKTPDQFAKDVNALLKHYLALWKLDKVAIVGYSFGADVAAFLPTKLEKGFADRLLPMVLLSPSYSSDFEVKLSDLMGSSSKEERKYNVQEALLKSTVPILCVFGTDEELYLKENLVMSSKITLKEIPGSHRYDNDVVMLTKLILDTVTQ